MTYFNRKKQNKTLVGSATGIMYYLNGLFKKYFLTLRLIAELNFNNIFTRSFYARSSSKRKNSVKSSVSFYTFGIYVHKSCT